MVRLCSVHSQSIYAQTSQEGIECTKAKESLRSFCLIYILCFESIKCPTSQEIIQENWQALENVSCLVAKAMKEKMFLSSEVIELKFQRTFHLAYPNDFLVCWIMIIS